MESLCYYNLIAKKLISSVGDKIYPGFSKIAIRDEEIIGIATEAVMIADWKYDHTRNIKKESYRYMHFIWTMHNYLRDNKKYRKHMLFSDLDTRGFNFGQMYNNEFDREQNFNDIIKRSGLSKHQADIMREIFIDGYTETEIAERRNVTRQAISYSYTLGAKKVKSYVETNKCN